MMRDLLYLSENKMRALAPQLPGRLRRRLGFEAGINAGVASAKATLASESQPPSIALLDAVVDMIEREKGSRWRTDGDLRPGDWIQFEEKFRYGDADPRGDGRQIPIEGLVYFAGTDGPPFVLCGSSVHVLDRWQSGNAPRQQVGHFYMAGLQAYARKLAELPDESATTEFVPPAERYGAGVGSLAYAISWLCDVETRDERNNGWVTGPVKLKGHARVLAVEARHDRTPIVLATPLYVEYAQRQ